MLLAAALLAACGPEPTAVPTPVPTATPTPSLDGAEETARKFLRHWQERDYERMHALLSALAQDEYPLERFVARYTAIANEAKLTGLTASVSDVQRLESTRAQVGFTVTTDSLMVGQFQVSNSLYVSFDGLRWGIDWSPESIFPLLVYDNLVHMFVTVPVRGSIYAANGAPLATNTELAEVGVVPGQIEDESRLLETLSAVLGLEKEAIRSSYAGAGRPDWFMPVGDLTPEVLEAHRDQLGSLPGVTWRSKLLRQYPQGDAAGQIVGYVAEISPQQLAELESAGYQPGDTIGASGLEAWGEKHLAGVRGATLAIISPDGRIVWTLASGEEQPSQDIHTTLDMALQQRARGILGSRVGAIVALDVRTGEVLALAGYPDYDPNVFIAGSSEERQALLADSRKPFLNRALAGLYPPGSTFKIVTMSAGMEYLGLSPSRSYYCAGRWDGLDDGAVRYCWQQTGHGTISFLHGLVYSCDTVFWEVGKALNELDPWLLSRHAASFGLGTVTGLNTLDEAPGLIPDPEWKASHYSGAEQAWLPRDAVNMAIGQGDVLVTPLQMASLAASVARGGAIYRPILVHSVGQGAEGNVPQIVGQLPTSPANLAIIAQAMQGVVSYGTASRAFEGASVIMAGKSGTSEAPPLQTHAWFVGYAPAYDPRIAVAVVLEHGGEGGADAAPAFRQVVEAYLSLADA